MGKNKQNQQLTRVGDIAGQRYQQTLNPSANETAFAPVADQMMGDYNAARTRQTQDYGDIMAGYRNFASNLSPTRFSYNRVSADNARPKELGEAYGYLREAAPGYREFAQTGGYSPTDIQELRARSTSPVRAAYGNTMMELNRARALGGAGGSPNYIAALSSAQREMPGQLADAMTGINAELARDIRQGRLAGLSGLTGIGGTMGGFASQEAGRDLQAQMANQAADLQAQGMSEESIQNVLRNKLAGLGGQANLYGTTPAMAATFGNQALNSWQQRAAMEQYRNQFGLGLIDAQTRAYGSAPQSQPWWQQALGVAGTVAPFFAMSSRELKEDIKPIKSTSKFAKYLKELPLYTWKYKGDSTKHFGPIAEEFKDKFGIGDGKTLHLADVMGVVLASQKEALNNA